MGGSKGGRRRIFGIGLSGTGTKTLRSALRILGWTPNEQVRCLDEIDGLDACADILVSCRYQALDQIFPGSLFILTFRDLESWLESRARKPPDDPRPSLFVLDNRIRMYGAIHPTREQYERAWRTHHEGVREYFRGRESDLLEMNITAGDGWEPLCRFLGLPVPDAEFPSIGSTKARRPFPLA